MGDGLQGLGHTQVAYGQGQVSGQPQQQGAKIGGQAEGVTQGASQAATQTLNPEGSSKSGVASRVQGNTNHVSAPSDDQKDTQEKSSSFLSKLTGGIHKAMQELKAGTSTFFSTTSAAMKGEKAQIPDEEKGASATKAGNAVGGALRYAGKRLNDAKQRINSSIGNTQERKQIDREIKEIKQKLAGFQGQLHEARMKHADLSQVPNDQGGKQFRDLGKLQFDQLEAKLEPEISKLNARLEELTNSQKQNPKLQERASSAAGNAMKSIKNFAADAKREIKFSAGIGRAAQERKGVDAKAKAVKQELAGVKEQLAEARTFHANASQIQGPHGETARAQTSGKVKDLEAQVEHLEGQLGRLSGYQSENAKLQEKISGAVSKKFESIKEGAKKELDSMKDMGATEYLKAKGQALKGRVEKFATEANKELKLSEKFESVKKSDLKGRVSTALGDLTEAAGKVAKGAKNGFEALGRGIRDLVVGKKGEGEEGARISKGLIGHVSDLGSAIKAGLPSAETLSGLASDIGKAIAKPFQALAALVNDKPDGLSQSDKNILTIADFFRPANTEKYQNSHLVFLSETNEFKILPKSKKVPADAITDPAKVTELVVNAIKNKAEEFASDGKVAAAQNFTPIGGGRNFGLSTIPQWMEGSYKLDKNQSLKVLASVMAGQNLGVARDNAKVFEENKGILTTLWKISEMPDDWKIEGASDTIGTSLPAAELFGIKKSNNFLGEIANDAVAKTEANLIDMTGTAEKLRQGKLAEAEAKLKELDTKFANGEIDETKYKDLKGKAESAINKWKDPDANSLAELLFAPTAVSQAFNQSAVEGMRKMFDKYCDNNIGKSYQPAAKWVSENSPGFAIYANWNAELNSKLDKLNLGSYVQDRKEINDLFEAAGSNTEKLPDLMNKIDEFVKKYPPEIVQQNKDALKQIQKDMGKPIPMIVKTSHPDHPGKILPDSVFTSDQTWLEPTPQQLADAEIWKRWQTSK
ncbi:hypothetical protein [Estrella lausannensis]|uniref:Uncharacterized protein n=1 Tax=Estrella lausannensis TaxID=483423 RepID=A0A0H5DRM6_9BACT|nr:hypothetical protein [Estrella lausannensis]CRX39247.1 Hypothetical protein ELAC_1922 [Estrella lausannensis]